MTDFVSTLIEQYRPKIVMNDDDLRERAQAAINTVRWWEYAHHQETPYHQQFRGYCPICASS